MPPKPSPICADCKKTESLLWRSVDNGQICQLCFELREAAAKEKIAAEDTTKPLESTDDKHKKATKDKNAKEDSKDVKEAVTPATEDKCSRLRKSTRATRFKTKALANHSNTTNGNGDKANAGGNSKAAIKGRNRRSLFKRMPLKTPHAQATTHSVESVFYKV